MLEDYKEVHARNKAIIAMLVNMAEVDNDLDLVEQQFIMDIAYQIGLNGDEIEDVFSNPDQFVLKPPKYDEERMTILYYLLFTMRIDGKIMPAEEELCYKAGLRLGFNHEMVEELIQVMKNYLYEEIPSELLLDAIRKYLN